MLFGFISLAIRYANISPHPMVISLFEGVGIGLIASGAVNLADRLLAERPKNRHVELTTLQRKTTPTKIHERKFEAKKFDGMGVTLDGCLRDLARPQMINHILLEDSRTRLLFVHPDANFLSQRFAEDGFRSVEVLKNRQKESIRLCVAIYRALKIRYEIEKSHGNLDKPRGKLFIKIALLCPYITIERYDSDMYWGLYTSDSDGESSPLFLTSRAHSPDLYDKLHAHFTTIFDLNGNQPDRLRLVQVDLDGVSIDRDIVQKILGQEETERLLPIEKKNTQ